MPVQTTAFPSVVDEYWTEGTSSGHPTSGYNSFYRTRGWSTTPGFRSKVKNRKIRTQLADLPMNAYDDYKAYHIRPVHQMTYLLPDGKTKGYQLGNFGVAMESPILNSDPRFTTLKNKAISRMPTKMDGTRFNAPLFFVELHKSTRMIAEAATTISGILAGAKSNRQLHNLWLEYRYGWRLMLRDIVDILKVIHELTVTGIKERVYVKTSLDEVSVSTTSFNNTGVIIYNRQIESIKRIEIADHLEVAYTILYKSDPVLSQFSQLGISNPMLLAWELVPYSFVLDWFVPVQDYLSSFDGFLGKTFVKGTVSTLGVRTETRKVLDIRWSPAQAGSSGTITGNKTVFPSTICTTRRYQRVPLTSWPSSQLPLIDVSLSLARVADAVSLLHNRRVSLQRRLPGAVQYQLNALR